MKNEQPIRKFLLGEMPEQERFEFEEKFITDPALFEEIKALEDDLIEKYVRGWMKPAEKSAFEQNYLTTKKRRETVEFSRRLIQKLQEDSYQKAFNETEKVSFWEKFGKLFSTPKIAAAAFAVLVIVFGSWFLFLNFRSESPEIVKNQNSSNSKISNQISEPKPEISPQNSENSSNNSIEESRPDSGTNSANQTNAPIKSPTPKKPEEKIEQTPETKKTPVQKSAPNPVLALFAGVLRSEGKSNELNLPSNVKGATFRLNLANVDYKTFQAELIDAEGNVIFRKGGLKPQKSKVNLFIPAKNLRKGDYVIKLSGKNDSGENESVADFQFRVNQ